jgi:GT2 family glycosyltransferase
MKTNMTSLTVHMILFGNAPGEILRSLESVANSAHVAQGEHSLDSWQILLGDCSPTPVFSSAEELQAKTLVAEFGGKFTYEFFDKNLGSAAGQNRLALASEDELIIIQNPDALPSPECFSRLIARLGPGVGSVEARQVPLEHPKDYDPKTGETAWSSTACLLTTREAFNRVGGFDSSTFFLYCDDVDFSWQLRLAGYKILYEPAATLFHDKRLTLRSEWMSSSAEIYYSAEAALMLAYKYSRPRVLSSMLKKMKWSHQPEHKEAVAEFRRRRTANELPKQIDPGNKVATFVHDNYTKHRF